MKSKKNIAIVIITAALTVGGLSLAKAKMYKHHFQHKTGHYEKGNEKGKHCWHYNNDPKKAVQEEE